MKIATFNVNNINKRLQNLLGWLNSSKPDVVCLQELKCMPSDFPAEALRKIGYEAVWCGEHSWNGVAILAREHVPVVTHSNLPGNPEDSQARYIEAAVNGILFSVIANSHTRSGRRSALPAADSHSSHRWSDKPSQAVTMAFIGVVARMARRACPLEVIRSRGAGRVLRQYYTRTMTG
jgi:exonuclease III